jgi:hypothetical protein
MNAPDLQCPWCQEHPLRVYEDPSDGKVHLGCSNPQATNCPDTTGKCATEAEAMRFAKKVCKPYPTKVKR